MDHDISDGAWVRQAYKRYRAASPFWPFGHRIGPIIVRSPEGFPHLFTERHSRLGLGKRKKLSSIEEAANGYDQSMLDPPAEAKREGSTLPVLESWTSAGECGLLATQTFMRYF